MHQTDREKLKRAQTDSDNAVRYDKENKPGISNLMGIYRAITKTAMKLSKKCMLVRLWRLQIRILPTFGSNTWANSTTLQWIHYKPWTGYHLDEGAAKAHAKAVYDVS